MIELLGTHFNSSKTRKVGDFIAGALLVVVSGQNTFAQIQRERAHVRDATEPVWRTTKLLEPGSLGCGRCKVILAG